MRVRCNQYMLSAEVKDNNSVINSDLVACVTLLTLRHVTRCKKNYKVCCGNARDSCEKNIV